MNCLSCGINMNCYNDVNDIGARIDWVRCPKCGATATIVYDVNSNKIIKNIWEQERQDGILTVTWEAKKQK